MDFQNIDHINQKLLELLSENSRISYAEMARQTHLSRVAVRERINNMVKKGIISEFTTVVSANRIGFPLSVFLEVEVEPRMLYHVAERLGAQDRVKIVYQMTGSTALHVHAFLEDSDALATFLQNQVYTIEGVNNVQSSILLKSFKSDLTIR